MSLRNEIKNKLIKELKVNEVSVKDVSYMHRGHVGYIDGKETHFELKIKCENLFKLNKVEAHRIIHKTLNEIIKKIHAINIKIERY